MAFPYFTEESLFTVSEALDIAEDKTGDFYKFSFGQWKRHHYDVKTQSSLHRDQISGLAFALLNKGSRVIDGYDSKTKNRDFYFICLQDHQILKAIRRDRNLKLLPLLVYIFTHELVHIVRFCNFFQRFEVLGENREREERVVHQTTSDILANLGLPNLGYILESYKHHRVCELLV